MYLNIPSAAMIGLSNKGNELNELTIVAPMDGFSRFTNSFEKDLESPSKSVIFKCGIANFSSLMGGITSIYSKDREISTYDRVICNFLIKRTVLFFCV